MNIAKNTDFDLGKLIRVNILPCPVNITPEIRKKARERMTRKNERGRESEFRGRVSYSLGRARYSSSRRLHHPPPLITTPCIAQCSYLLMVASGRTKNTDFDLGKLIRVNILPCPMNITPENRKKEMDRETRKN